jgi:hypothetical protein
VSGVGCRPRRLTSRASLRSCETGVLERGAAGPLYLGPLVDGDGRLAVEAFAAPRESFGRDATDAGLPARAGAAHMAMASVAAFAVLFGVVVGVDHGQTPPMEGAGIMSTARPGASWLR